jgi:hypothetical protein
MKCTRTSITQEEIEMTTHWMNGFAEMSLKRDRLETVLKKLIWAARTSGGVAGRDEGLCAACDEAEREIEQAGSGKDTTP